MIDVLFVDLDLFCFHFAVCCCCWSIVGSLIRWVLGVYYLSNTLLGSYFVFVIVFFLRETLCWLFCSCWFTFVFVFDYLRDWFFVWLIFISFVCLNVKVVALSLVVFVELVLVNFLWWYCWHFFCFNFLFCIIIFIFGFCLFMCVCVVTEICFWSCIWILIVSVCGGVVTMDVWLFWLACCTLFVFRRNYSIWAYLAPYQILDIPSSCKICNVIIFSLNVSWCSCDWSKPIQHLLAQS